MCTELELGEIGEQCEAMDGAGIKLLLALGSTEVSLEDTEPVIVLLINGVGLSELEFGVLEVFCSAVRRRLQGSQDLRPRCRRRTLDRKIRRRLPSPKVEW